MLFYTKMGCVQIIGIASSSSTTIIAAMYMMEYLLLYEALKLSGEATA